MMKQFSKGGLSKLMRGMKGMMGGGGLQSRSQNPPGVVADLAIRLVLSAVVRLARTAALVWERLF